MKMLISSIFSLMIMGCIADGEEIQEASTQSHSLHLPLNHHGHHLNPHRSHQDILFKLAKAVGRHAIEKAVLGDMSVEDKLNSIAALASTDAQKELFNEAKTVLEGRLQAAANDEAKLTDDQRAVLTAAKATAEAHQNELKLYGKLSKKERQEIFRVLHPLRVPAPGEIVTHAPRQSHGQDKHQHATTLQEPNNADEATTQATAPVEA